MILEEFREPSLQNIKFVEEENNEMHNEALDLAKETIKKVHMGVELYYRKAEKRYYSRVKLRNFRQVTWY